MELLQNAIREVVVEVFGVNHPIFLSVPDEQFGDAATNIALQLSKTLGKAPREIAEELLPKITALPTVVSCSVAGPGFINLRISDEFLAVLARQTPRKIYQNKVVVFEYSDPNPFTRFIAAPATSYKFPITSPTSVVYRCPACSTLNGFGSEYSQTTTLF
jgi:arginyl-tRNA synthetase